MSYADDAVWNPTYEDKLEKEKTKKWAIRRHKWISLMVFGLAILTVVYVILMVQFYEVLKEL